MAEREAFPDLGDPKVNANDIIAWLERQPETSLISCCEELYDQLLAGASRPRHSSVLACTKLCGFLQHCTRSSHDGVRHWAFSEPTAMRLFNFYIEWNEKDQHRSMRLVLDLLTVVIAQNPDQAAGAAVRRQVLDCLVSIIARRSTRPLVKSCINSLNHLLGKGVYRLGDVSRTYRQVAVAEEEKLGTVAETSTLSDIGLWRRFCGDLVSWMCLHYVCSVAGKLLVTIFRSLRELALHGGSEEAAGVGEFTVQTWLGWLQEELSANPGILENIKLYVFVPLFKTDRPASLELLDSVNRPTQTSSSSSAIPPQSGSGSGNQSQNEQLDSSALLRLAALEVGKKSGLVEDPGSHGTPKSSKAVVLDVQVMEGVLSHQSPSVRLLALSLLVTSPSSSKPYPREALALIRKNLPSYHADPGAGFRQEALAHTKVMIKRIKGTIASGQKVSAPATTADPAALSPPDVPSANGVASGSGTKPPRKLPPAAVKEAVPEETIKDHEAFFKWYLDFLVGELVPTASYQRHITALKAALQVLQFGKETAGAEEGPTSGGSGALTSSLFLDYSWIRSILDLVIDPFSDVRETAILFLMLAPPDVINQPMRIGAGQCPSPGTLVDIVRQFRSQASELASRTGRADHGDGSARLQGLLCSWSSSSLDQQLDLVIKSVEDIERKIEVARHDITKAVMECPVHGDFASISCMWEVLTKAKYSDDELQRLVAVQRRVVPLCKNVWDIVRPILCDDSPEGHLPQEMEDAEGLDTKGLLSYSFRAIHESSNTMRLMIAPLKFSRVKGTMCPARDVFQDIGSLTFDQLASLRHRGAFSTVSLTFTTCCQLVGDPLVTPVGSPPEETLLFAWYKGTLGCIFAQASTTRRSAGIPALMTGILAAAPAAAAAGRPAEAPAAATRPSFDEVMAELGEIAQRPARVSETDGSNLPQVHALNCIKDVFKSSLLSVRAERYLPTFLQVAAGSLRSEVWAIRNCGLLLLRSVIDCLLGNSDSKALLEAGWDGRTTRISYVKYPALPTILLSLLQEGQQAQDTESQRRAAESVFPALDIIRRAGPPDSHRDRLYDCVAGYLASHLWHVREIAARTLSSFLVSMDWLAEIRALLARSRPSANMLHGTLLTAKFLVEKGVEVLGSRLIETLPELEGLLEETAEFKTLQACPEIQAVLLETLNLISGLYGTSLPSPGCAAVPPSSSGAGQKQKSPLASSVPAAASPALLQTQLALGALQRAAAASEVESLRDAVLAVASQDADAAAVMIASIPQVWASSSAPVVSSRLCRIYIDVARQLSDAEIRVQALVNLTEALDALITAGEVDLLPPTQDLRELWITIQKSEANPAVLHAGIRVSGPLMAALCLQCGQQDAHLSLDRQLRTWAVTMSQAGLDDNAFDTREAAAQALKSFSSAIGPWCTASVSYLPFLLALYDTLNDDEEEIRDIGASAAAPVLSGRLLYPVQAAEALIAALCASFSASQEFQSYAVLRAVGQSQVHPTLKPLTPASLNPPDAQLRAALAVDDSLFIVEEQNLFIDEVREARRWCGVLGRLPFEDPSLLAVLRGWVDQGLAALAEQASRQTDGPLGWASAPKVFDICSRVLLSGAVLARVRGDVTLATKLVVNRDVLSMARLHGVLLSAVDGDGPLG